MVNLHRVAKLYGRLPSEIAERSIFHFGFDCHVARVGVEQDIRDEKTGR